MLTLDVSGSHIQLHAPVAVATDTRMSSTAGKNRQQADSTHSIRSTTAALFSVEIQLYSIALCIHNFGTVSYYLLAVKNK